MIRASSLSLAAVALWALSNSDASGQYSSRDFLMSPSGRRAASAPTRIRTSQPRTSSSQVRRDEPIPADEPEASPPRRTTRSARALGIVADGEENDTSRGDPRAG